MKTLDNNQNVRILSQSKRLLWKTRRRYG